MRKPSVLVIFLTVFIDLIGFGIVLPLLPMYSRNLGASGLLIGLVQASYSAMQFLFAPGWGRLSDRIGRRPVLLVSTAGAAVSYVLFATGCGLAGHAGLWVVLASRVLAGLCGANITVAQAYIADITPPEERSRRMGLIGMAFGLGFVFGPPLGSLGIHLFGLRGSGGLGRLFVILSSTNDPEPRLMLGQTRPDAPAALARDQNSFAPGAVAVLDKRAFISPGSSLSQLHPGDYFVQALFDFNKDLRSPNAPGNLFSLPQKLRLNPSRGARFLLELSRQVPPEQLPPETEYVKFIKLESRLLSQFHCRPIFLRA